MPPFRTAAGRALLAGLLLVSACGSGSAGTATVSGAVSLVASDASGSESPVAGQQVMLIRTSGPVDSAGLPTDTWTALTGADGRFQFVVAGEGEYAVGPVASGANVAFHVAAGSDPARFAVGPGDRLAVNVSFLGEAPANGTPYRLVPADHIGFSVYQDILLMEEGAAAYVIAEDRTDSGMYRTWHFVEEPSAPGYYRIHDEVGDNFIFFTIWEPWRYLAVRWASMDAGVDVLAWPAPGSDNHLWKLLPIYRPDRVVYPNTYMLQNRRSGMCLDWKDTSVPKGTSLVQRPCGAQQVDDDAYRQSQVFGFRGP